MVSRYSAYRRGVGDDTIAPEVVDRILMGACAAIYLVLLGVSVAAAVALADLGRGFHKAASEPAHHLGAVRRHRCFGADHRGRDPHSVARRRRMSQSEPAAQAMTAPARGPARPSVADRRPAHQRNRHGANGDTGRGRAEWSGRRWTESGCAAP